MMGPRSSGKSGRENACPSPLFLPCFRLQQMKKTDKEKPVIVGKPMGKVDECALYKMSDVSRRTVLTFPSGEAIRVDCKSQFNSGTKVHLEYVATKTGAAKLKVTELSTAFFQIFAGTTSSKNKLISSEQGRRPCVGVRQ